MNRILFILFVSSLLFSGCTNQEKDLVVLKTDSFNITIDEAGYVSLLTDATTGFDYLAKDTIAPVMSIRVNKQMLYPQTAMLDQNILVLSYDGGFEAQVEITQKESHFTFELVSITNKEAVELIVWGPYPTTVNQVIGETVGVVQGETFAMGIQSINPKTLGGYPWNENDALPKIDIQDQDDFADMKEGEHKRYVLFRVEAAKPANFGSTLQAYSRNRSEDRVIENLNHDKYVAPAYDDGGFIGSKIALFGTPVSGALETIGKIEIAESLPHPMINGEWAKTTRAAAAAYMIMPFGEDNIEKVLAITKKAGLKYLYHPEPFENWGHFELNKKQFPNGDEGMRRCVEKANQEGIVLGLHTLSNFITLDDPYVTPIPDPRLAKVGSSVLVGDIDENQTNIPIASPDYFNQYRNNHLKTVMVENELIRYGDVSKNEPWQLIDCQRGAFNTTASAHRNRTKINKLTDHGYKIFLTNNALGKEMSERLVELYNNTGLRQIGFDGVEGNQSTGMGHYAEALFVKTWFDGVNDEIKNHFIASSSRTNHYLWHIYNRMNWGEPWYDGFRESQTKDRLHNQKFYKRNLMPAMLGWFLMTPETSLEDIEWLLARSASFDAGYAFVTSDEALAKNGNANKIMQLVGDWEKLRIAGVLSATQKREMEDISTEYALNKQSEKEWNLSQVYSGKFKHANKVRQPGEPLYSTFEFEHSGDTQIMHFILSASDGNVSEITMELDNYKKIVLPVKLKSGQFIKYSGGKMAYVYDNYWQVINEFSIDSEVFKVSNGPHNLTFDAQFSEAGQDAMVKLETRTFGQPQKLKLPE